MASVVHFEIHASDPQRAIEFYTKVFGWDIQQWGDKPYWLIMTSDKLEAERREGQGINGAIMPRLHKGPVLHPDDSLNAYVCTIKVDNLEDTIELVKRCGGKHEVQMQEIPEVGSVAYCRDTENNLFGILEPKKS